MKIRRTAPKGQDVRDLTRRLVLTAETDAEAWALARFVGKEGSSRLDDMLEESEAEYMQEISDQLEKVQK